MRNIYTSVDIGSDTIKALVVEHFDDRFNVLAKAVVLSEGVKKGLIVDDNLCGNSIKKALKKLESKINSKIDKVVVNIPTNHLECNILTGAIKIENEEKVVTGIEIEKCLDDALSKNDEVNTDVVTILPIEFDLDNIKLINPLNKHGDYLKVKAIASIVPKKNIYSVLNVFKNIGIEVIDIGFSILGDYYSVRNDVLDKSCVSVINIGKDKTEVSVFNKGMLIKSSIIDMGANNITHDIEFLYKLDNVTSQSLKEQYAFANKRYADVGENIEVKNKFDEVIKISQVELSEVVSSRVVEILKNAKNEINNLTNREIGYIIITGAVTDILGFGATASDVLGSNAQVLNMSVIGIRSNKYSSCFGLIKYFRHKLDLLNKDYSMFASEKIDDMLSIRKKSDGNVLSKIFDRFFE